MQTSSNKPAGFSPAAGLVKRLGDLLLSLLLSLLTLPLTLVIVVAVSIKGRGNPFYVQRRVGKGGRELRVLKFRTMKKGADQVEKTMSPAQLALYRTEFKLPDDPRLLGYREGRDNRHCFGALLRRTSLDELPQLWYNVLPGSMSLVGPRPVLRKELELHYSKEEQQALLALKPGLTGYWQAYARNDVTYANGERQKMELCYAKSPTLWFDFKILCRTALAVIRKTGAK